MVEVTAGEMEVDRVVVETEGVSREVEETAEAERDEVAKAEVEKAVEEPVGEGKGLAGTGEADLEVGWAACSIFRRTRFRASTRRWNSPAKSCFLRHTRSR